MPAPAPSIAAAGSVRSAPGTLASERPAPMRPAPAMPNPRPVAAPPRVAPSSSPSSAPRYPPTPPASVEAAVSGAAERAVFASVSPPPAARGTANSPIGRVATAPASVPSLDAHGLASDDSACDSSSARCASRYSRSSRVAAIAAPTISSSRPMVAVSRPDDMAANSGSYRSSSAIRCAVRCDGVRADSAIAFSRRFSASAIIASVSGGVVSSARPTVKFRRAERRSNSSSAA